MEILIGDDHSVVRRGIAMILRDAYPLAHIEEAGDGAELVKKLTKKNWTLVISDITMPGRSGLDVIKMVKEHYPHTPVLILSMHPPEHYAVRAYKAGASGYLTKESAPEELVKAVEMILSGKKFINAEVADMLLNYQLNQDVEEPHKSLSDREMEVFELLAKGKKLFEIADELSLSVNTISTYRGRILEKLHLTSNAEIAKYALQHGFV